MKEAVMASGGERVGRSASEKEKTKMRERQRRGITTKIFNGLRKHGGYNLSPRADINEVLRELARESGWVVQPDGTTYRSSTNAFCPVCGAGKRSTTPTPTSSIGVAGGGGGECSTTTSPRRLPGGDSTKACFGGGPTYPYFSSDASGGSIVNASSSQDLTSDRDIPVALYMYERLAGGFNPSAATATGGGPSAMAVAYHHHHQQQQQLYLQEARASNQNTPVGSPLRRA